MGRGTMRAGAALMGVAGLAAVVVGLRAQPASLRTGATEFVNDRSGSVADRANNSPSVAVDPRNPSTIVVANQLDAPALGCALSVSTNSGASWVPLPSLPPILAATNCYWPRAAYLPDGTLLVLSTDLVGISLLPGRVWLHRFDGDLRPEVEPQQVAGELAFHARLAVDGTRVWLSWVQAGPATADNQLGFAPGDNPVMVARSSDGGRTFSPPVRVGDGRDRVIQPTVVAHGQTVTVGALDLADDVLDYQATHDGQTPPEPALRWRIVAWTSLDGGATFGPKAVVAGDLPVPQLIIADLGPTPGFAVDTRTGRLYAAWDAGRGNARDVSLARSDDGGRTWSKAVRVGPRKGSQLLPAVSVSDGGRVDVVFYDRSRDAQDRLQEVVAASSSDGGRTFRWARISDASSDSRVGLGAQQGVPLQGDHLGIQSRSDGILALWADTGRGTPVDAVEDLAVASVDLAGGGRRPAVTAVGAALLFAAGALLVLARPGRAAG